MLSHQANKESDIFLFFLTCFFKFQRTVKTSAPSHGTTLLTRNAIPMEMIVLLAVIAES